jgi:hypothetical protein
MLCAVYILVVRPVVLVGELCGIINNIIMSALLTRMLPLNGVYNDVKVSYLNVVLLSNYDVQ